ncbi:MAG: hypothetical protein HY749_13505 [Gammaproteobacteria bacterium]|nr:hypothetical protein [Gammaproteobacteria bacterium]MBI5618933.1 hypothetical protein [Gammaproteobacteria bacterium]
MKYAITASAGLALVLASAAATADLYQWTDPATRVRQLSGRPPAWYRGEAPGPRVRVFAHGQLMDDTAIAVSTDEAATLRARAFGTPAASEARPTTAETAPPESTVVLPPPPPPPATAAPGANAADMKALIEAWDRDREARARSVLRETSPPPPPADGAPR